MPNPLWLSRGSTIIENTNHEAKKLFTYVLVIRDSQVLAKLGVVLVRPVLLNFHWNLKELRPD